MNLGFHSPAAKAWQVSRHTPTLVWSLTLSMILFSSENLLPTVLPWPLMFSNTDHTEGKTGKESHHQSDTPIPPVCYNTWYTCKVGLPALVHSWSIAWGLVLPLPHCFHRHSAAVYSCHTSSILGMWVKRTVVVCHESQVTQRRCQACSQVTYWHKSQSEVKWFYMRGYAICFFVCGSKILILLNKVKTFYIPVLLIGGKGINPPNVILVTLVFNLCALKYLCFLNTK